MGSFICGIRWPGSLTFDTTEEEMGSLITEGGLGTHNLEEEFCGTIENT